MVINTLANISSFPNVSNKNTQNLIPKIEWMMAMINGNKKKIATCLNRALFSCFSLAPILRNIEYLVMLSVLSDNSFKASKAALDIKKIIPR